MSPDKLFVRDPRTVQFLQDEVKKILELADSASRQTPIRDDDHFGFMTIHFLYKQMQHAGSILSLVPRRDAGLVARTMVDGLYQLLWASHKPQERALRWRSFSAIHDWRLIQRQIGEGVSVEKEIIAKNSARLEAFGHEHLKNPKRSDPYHKSWRGDATLSDMAKMVGPDLYDGSYAELSDWEHWGVAAIGESISLEDTQAVVMTNSSRIAGLSLTLAFQCLFQTLEVADRHLGLKITDTLEAVGREFKETMDPFRQA